MRIWRAAATMLFLAGTLARCGGPEAPAPPAGPGDIHLDPSVRFQVISGWEAHSQSGESSPRFADFRDQLFDLAVDDLGITRVRVEVMSGMENTRDVFREAREGVIDRATARCLRFSTVNDDDDPGSAHPAGFHFSALDQQMEQVVMPLRQRLEARGERLFLNLNYVAFVEQMDGAGCPAGLEYHHTTPDEYAEFMLAMVRHLDSRYGIVPDAIEFLLEPEHNRHWSGRRIGQGIVATAGRLAAAGYQVPFIAPSTTSMANAITYFDAMIRVPGVAGHLAEFSYHRYRGVSDANLRAIASRAERHGVRTSMLEHIGSGHEDLHKDLALGGASAWQQFALAFPTEDNGAQYYVVDEAAGRVTMGDRTRYLRQYFRWVRPGAQRIAAGSRRPELDPLAFVHPTLGEVVVVRATAPATFTVSGLSAGTYGTSFTTASATGEAGPEASIAEGGVLSATIPAPGVVTIFRK